MVDAGRPGKDKDMSGQSCERAFKHLQTEMETKHGQAAAHLLTVNVHQESHMQVQPQWADVSERDKSPQEGPHSLLPFWYMEGLGLLMEE